MFYDTSDDQEILNTRPRDLRDNARLSALPIASLGQFHGIHCPSEARWTAQRGAYYRYSHQALAQTQPMMSQYPLGFGQWLRALSSSLAKPKEIAIIDKLGKSDTQAMLRVAAENYQPFQIIETGDPITRTPVVPPLQNINQIDGRATAYVCVDFSCRAPVTES